MKKNFLLLIVFLFPSLVEAQIFLREDTIKKYAIKSVQEVNKRGERTNTQTVFYSPDGKLTEIRNAYSGPEKSYRTVEFFIDPLPASLRKKYQYTNDTLTDSIIYIFHLQRPVSYRITKHYYLKKGNMDSTYHWYDTSGNAIEYEKRTGWEIKTRWSKSVNLADGSETRVIRRAYHTQNKDWLEIDSTITKQKGNTKITEQWDRDGYSKNITINDKVAGYYLSKKYNHKNKLVRLSEEWMDSLGRVTKSQGEWKRKHRKTKSLTLYTYRTHFANGNTIEETLIHDKNNKHISKTVRIKDHRNLVLSELSGNEAYESRNSTYSYTFYE